MFASDFQKSGPLCRAAFRERLSTNFEHLITCLSARIRHISETFDSGRDLVECLESALEISEPIPSSTQQSTDAEGGTAQNQRPQTRFLLTAVNQRKFFFWNTRRFCCVSFVVETEEERRKNFVKRSNMMFPALPISERIDILSPYGPEHFSVRPDEKVRSRRNNFSHLFALPRYPIYLGSIRPQASHNVSAGDIGLCGQRRGGC